MRKFLFAAGFVVVALGLVSQGAFAANGSGTITVSPTSTTVGSTGGTYTFIFTAAETMNTGGITITVPSGWSTPQGVAGTAGYTTISSTGSVGRVLDNADSITGWGHNTSGNTACSGGLILDSTTQHEGTGSVKCINSNDKNNGLWYKNITAQNWSTYATVNFWIKVSSGINNGDLNFDYSASSNIASPIESIALPNTIIANTWTYVSFPFAAASSTRTSVISYGLHIKNLSNLKNATVWVDDLLIGSTAGGISVPTFSGNTITINALTLTAGQTVTITYGAGGGTSGATATSTAGTSTFTTQSRISDTGTLTNVVTSPTVSVRNPVPTTTSISPTSTTAGGAQFTLTVNGTNFVPASVVNWNGSARTTTYVSANQLTAVIPATDIATGGTASVTVFNPTPGGGTSNSQTFTTISLGTASLTLAHPGSMNARTRAGYTVTRKDQFGGLVTNGTTTVYLYTNSSSTNAKFYNDSLAGSQITSATISPGQSAAAFWYYDDTPGTATITASDNSSAPDGATGIADGTDTITVLPVATKFVIIQPANGTVDAAITVTVQAQKPDNSVDTNYQSDVTLNVSGSATGGGLVDIINGVGTKNISDTVTETVNLGLTDSQATGLDVASSKQVTFGVGALAQYTLNNPGSTGAGTRAAYTVTRKDQYGNLITSGTNTVYLYSNSSSTNKKFYDAASAGSIITSVTISGGQSSAGFWYYDDTLGSWTVTASDNATAPDGVIGVNDALDSITIMPGAVATFALSHPGTMTVGTRAAYTVTRRDVFGNLVTSGATSVYLYSSSVSTSSAFYLASSGGSPVTVVTINNTFSTANFWYTDGVAGTYTITASDNAVAPNGATGIADGTDNLTVSLAPIIATKFVILNPNPATVDAAATIMVQAQDNSGSLHTTFNGTVTLSTTGSATGGGMVTITNGVGTKNISDTRAESVTLTLSDTGSTGLDVSSSRTLTFALGALAQLSVTSPGDMAAGTRQALTLTRKDQFGNGVISGLTTSYLYSASTNVNMRFYDASSGGSSITSVNFAPGVSSTQVWYYDETSATTTVTISDNATAPDGLTGIADGSAFVHIVPDPVAKFILSSPGNMFVGTKIGYMASRQDAYGNNVYSGISLVYLYSNSTGVSKKFYDAATAGNIITTIPIDDSKTSASFWYYDIQPGTWNVTASDNVTAPDGATGIADGVDSLIVSLVPIVATNLVILSAGPSQIGSPVAVVIQAEDNSGNVQTDYNNSVTLGVSGSATGGRVVNIVNGTGVASVNDLTAETITLSLTDSSPTGLNVSSVQSLTFTTAPVLQPGFAGGGSPLNPGSPVIVGGVIFRGRAYPGAKLSILSLGAEATILTKSTVASTDGTFEIAFRGISTGARSYGLLVQDKTGGIAQTKLYDLTLLNSKDILEVNNILTSPTVGFARGTVTKGDRLTVVGYSTPGSTVNFLLDGQPTIEKAQAGTDGSYKVLLRTGDLALGSHTIKGKQTDSFGKTSDQSTQKIFSVSNLLVPQVDFNNDGKVNITDASVFLARFNSTDPKVRTLDDINGDKKVDVTDFSIFLRTLRLAF